MSAVDPQTFHSAGLPLSSMLDGSTAWERTLVPIGPAVRVTAGIVGAMLGMVLVLQCTLLSQLAETAAPPGFILFGWSWLQVLLTATEFLVYPYMALLTLLTSVAVLTRGLSIAGRRLQLVLAGLVIASVGCLAPPICIFLIAVLNAGAWVVMIALAGLVAASVAALSD